MRRIQWLSPEEAEEMATRAARALSKDPNVRLVYLFGSTAAGRPARDVDLGVLTREPLSDDKLANLAADLRAEAAGPIDLVSLNDAPVVLAFEIADTGHCLHAGDPDAEVEFVTRARARYWDFKPYLEEQWRLAGERLEERLRGSTR